MAGNPQRRDKAREIARVVRKLRGSDDLVCLVIVTATDPHGTGTAIDREGRHLR